MLIKVKVNLRVEDYNKIKEQHFDLWTASILFGTVLRQWGENVSLESLMLLADRVQDSGRVGRGVKTKLKDSVYQYSI